MAQILKILNIRLLFSLLFISISGLFISGWNSFINGKPGILIPFIFLILSYLFLLFLALKSTTSPINPEETRCDDINESTTKEKPASDPVYNPVDSDMLLLRIIGKTNHGDQKTNALNILRNLASEFNIMQGVFYTYSSGDKLYNYTAAYAFTGKDDPSSFAPGLGLHGQAALDKKVVEISNLPKNFTRVMSGLGSTYSRYLYLIPFLYENETIALIEFTTFKDIGPDYMLNLNSCLDELGKMWKQLNENEQ